MLIQMWNSAKSCRLNNVSVILTGVQFAIIPISGMHYISTDILPISFRCLILCKITEQNCLKCLKSYQMCLRSFGYYVCLFKWLFLEP